MSDQHYKSNYEEFHYLSRRDFLRLVGWTGGSAALASFLASCAPRTTEVPPTGVVPTATQVAVTATPSGPKILKIRMLGDIAGIDPAFMVGLTDSLISDCVFSGLIRQKLGSYDWTNDLVEEITPSTDGLSVDFTLKQGVMFHKGYGELTTDDVKFSFERIADPKVQSSYATDWLTLDHVEAIDKYHGKIILKQPFAPLWTSTLPVNSGKIVCKAQVDKVGAKAMTLDPVGSGPYIFDTWKPQEKIILKRNPDYYGEQVYFDEIDMFPIVDDLAAETAMEAGELDCTIISLGSTKRFQANPNYNVDKRQGLLYTWIGMDVENPKLADINVRQAIRYGVDINQILAGVYFGEAERAGAMIPPGIAGFWKDAPQYDRDVAKAKDFLSKAGLKTLDLTYTAGNDAQSKAMAEIVQQNLAEVGINITINALDASSLWQAGMGDNGKKLEIFPMTFSMYADPSWATAWFTSDQVGIWNWMRWRSKEYDDLHLKGVTTLDPTQRNDIYIQMQKLFDDACIAVWITHGAIVHVYKKDLLPAFTPNGQDQVWYYKNA